MFIEIGGLNILVSLLRKYLAQDQFVIVYLILKLIVYLGKDNNLQCGARSLLLIFCIRKTREFSYGDWSVEIFAYYNRKQKYIDPLSKIAKSSHAHYNEFCCKR